MPEDVSVTFNSEVDLNDDAVGRYLASSGSVRSTNYTAFSLSCKYWPTTCEYEGIHWECGRTNSNRYA